jgi:pyridinium-3,5-biscarboxylic acid mononucleotide sulfurtransferase
MVITHPAGAGLPGVLKALPLPCIAAVSGGVDSLLLAVVAGRVLGENLVVAHAVGPAVPGDGTDRVRETAAAEGWRLYCLTAGEMDDPAYVANPADRCFHCKSRLYAALGALAREVFPGRSATIVSGANTDDLADYRPGLAAAKRYGVRHPLLEAGLAKADIRAVARELQLPFADIPSSPCLSSRIFTGTPITTERLAAVGLAEDRLRRELGLSLVRCRVEGTAMRVELDPERLADANFVATVTPVIATLDREIPARFPSLAAVTLDPAGYARGRAFKRNTA